MTELSGTLDGVGLPAIVRFLTGLGKTGSLRIAQADWRGDVFFKDGRVQAASLEPLHGPPLEPLHGLQALDAIIQVLPSGEFTFASDDSASIERSIELGPDTLQQHLDELAARTVTGGPALPSLLAVPELVLHEEQPTAAEPLPLDRGMLQTLLVVDGQRSVREIVAQRGSFDALWQLGRLSDVGLVRIATPSDDASPARGQPGDAPRPAEAEGAQPTPPPAEAHQTAGPCPKLGFKDDPANSFSRPTRLHCCFATGALLPLSLDEQRELCLTNRFSTCPRLVAGAPAPTSSLSSTAAASASRAPVASARPGPVASPFTAPAAVASPSATAAPVPLTTPSPPAAAPQAASGPRAAAGPRVARGPRLGSDAALLLPPLRPRPPRASAPESPAAQGRLVDAPAAETIEPARAQPHRLALPMNPRLPSVAGIALGVLVVGLTGALLVPRIVETTDDEASKLAALPNTSAVTAGTPVSDLAGLRATPVGTRAAASAARAEAASVPASTTDASAASPTAAPTPQPTSAGPRRLLEQHFADITSGWPSNPQGTAWLTGGSYRITTRVPRQFVAIGAPITESLRDVTVDATFHKIDGPAGGGYGIIVRDQGPGPRDGINQGGRYYVLEVGDKGEVGIWRRETDQWVDLVPWRHSDAVRTGTAINQLSVRAIGNTLTLLVNGGEVASRSDTELSAGGVGIFVGGDGNQVALDQLTIQTP